LSVCGRSLAGRSRIPCQPTRSSPSSVSQRCRQRGASSQPRHAFSFLTDRLFSHSVRRYALRATDIGELDYVQECRHLQAVHDAIMPSFGEVVAVPVALPQLCTGKVLTMSYLDGPKLEEEARRQLLSIGVDVSSGSVSGMSALLLPFDGLLWLSFPSMLSIS